MKTKDFDIFVNDLQADSTIKFAFNVMPVSTENTEDARLGVICAFNKTSFNKIKSYLTADAFDFSSNNDTLSISVNLI